MLESGGPKCAGPGRGGWGWIGKFVRSLNRTYRSTSEKRKQAQSMGAHDSGRKKLVPIATSSLNAAKPLPFADANNQGGTAPSPNNH